MLDKPKQQRTKKKKKKTKNIQRNQNSHTPFDLIKSVLFATEQPTQLYLLKVDVKPTGRAHNFFRFSAHSEPLKLLNIADYVQNIV